METYLYHKKILSKIESNIPLYSGAATFHIPTIIKPHKQELISIQNTPQPL